MLFRSIIMIDLDDNRLAVARRFGATHTFNSSREDVVRLVRDLTDSKGVDAAIEAVGVPATFGLCEELVAPGGVIANVGVHGTKVDLHLEQLWSRNVTITTRLVDTVSRSDEHTSELQSLMRISYAVLCLKKKII